MYVSFGERRRPRHALIATEIAPSLAAALDQCSGSSVHDARQKGLVQPAWRRPHEDHRNLLAQPGTTLMLRACNARMPARTTGAGCIINSFNAGVIFCCAVVANPVSDMPGQSAVTVTQSRLSSR